MRVIITGGSGLIGSALALDLSKDNHQVVVLSRNPKKVNQTSPNLEVVAWDARTADGWGKLADGADVIINLAGENISGEGMFPSRWTEERKKRIIQSRIDAGHAVMEAVRDAQNKPRVLIQASAIGYYPPNTGRKMTEGDQPGTGFQTEVLKQYEASTAPVDGLGVRRVIIRSGVVLSTAGGAFLPQVLPFKMFAGGPIGSGRQGYSWIHIADEVAAIRFLIDHPAASGAFNVTSPNPVTNREFGRTIARVMGRPFWMPVPAFALKLAFGEVSEILLDGWLIMPKRLLDMGFNFRYPDAESAVRNLLRK